MNTIENNRLIAEFMGEYIPPQAKYGDMNFWKYHESWDWLMPIIRKINNTGLYHKKYKNINLASSLLTGYLLSVYEQIIEFIIWYNMEVKNGN